MPSSTKSPAVPRFTGTPIAVVVVPVVKLHVYGAAIGSSAALSAAIAIVATYAVLAASSAAGTLNATVVAVEITEPATGPAADDSVNVAVVSEARSIGSLNVALMPPLSGTLSRHPRQAGWR